jgi:hypothetical protein
MTIFGRKTPYTEGDVTFSDAYMFSKRCVEFFISRIVTKYRIAKVSKRAHATTAQIIDANSKTLPTRSTLYVIGKYEFAAITEFIIVKAGNVLLS